VTTGQQWLAIFFGAGITAVAIEANPYIGGAFLALLVVAMVAHYQEESSQVPGSTPGL
jgi:hypothetical protein